MAVIAVVLETNTIYLFNCMESKYICFWRNGIYSTKSTWIHYTKEEVNSMNIKVLKSFTIEEECLNYLNTLVLIEALPSYEELTSEPIPANAFVELYGDIE